MLGCQVTELIKKCHMFEKEIGSHWEETDRVLRAGYGIREWMLTPSLVLNIHWSNQWNLFHQEQMLKGAAATHFLTWAKSRYLWKLSLIVNKKLNARQNIKPIYFPDGEVKQSRQWSEKRDCVKHKLHSTNPGESFPFVFQQTDQWKFPALS